MALAANKLIAFTAADGALPRQGDILAHVAMPITGMLSDLLRRQELARQFGELRDLSAEIADWSRPTGYLRLSKAPASPAMPDHI